MTQQQFEANGLITLSSDFGERDPFVGLMKGVILGRFIEARIIDLCHGLPKFQPQSAGFWLERCWPYFPAGTVHLAVVDPGVGGNRAMKWLKLRGQLFVAPDNALLDSLETFPDWQGSQVFDLEDLQSLHLGSISRTFHGRDVFAPLVAELAAGREKPEKIGRSIPASRRERMSPAADSTGLRGTIRAIDDFGNLLTDIDADVTSSTSNQFIQYKDQVIEFKETYSAVPLGNLLTLVNSFGVVEIAVAQGNAQQRLQASIGDPVWLISRK